MRKGLSLKKTSSETNRQKTITHFFKNTAPSSSSSDRSSQNVAKPASSSIPPVKRKASSPLKISEATEATYCNSKNSNQHGTLDNKKYKFGTSPEKIEKANSSPSKENGYVKQSIKRNNTNHVVALFVDKKKSLNINNSDIKTDRIPLTPVTLENVQDEGENGFTTLLNHVERATASCIQNNKTPEKHQTHRFISHTLTYEKTHGETTESITKNKGVHWSPQEKTILTTEALTKEELSPSKSGSTVSCLDFCEQEVGQLFDNWEVNDVEVDGVNDLDLSIMQRCEVLTVRQHPTNLEIRVKNSHNRRGTCFIDGIWLDTPLIPGETVSILASRDSSNQFHIGNTSGLLVLRPDHLVSSTSVVGGVFCKRKAILQERWRGIDSANTAMTIGIFIHELVQKALTHKIYDVNVLTSEANKIIEGSLDRLYDAGLTEEEARSNMKQYISPLAEFMHNYVGKTSTHITQSQKDKWNGHIDEVLDIEENLCCPQLGLKGKIDATLQVTIHHRNKDKETAVVPLELKSGKASASAEHRGQLVLYGMMLSAQQQADPTRAVQRGLLLYLKERVEIREVSCGYPERRDLMMLRNQLVQHLAASPNDVDPEQIADIEEASLLLQQKLPDPVHHENACTKCPYLTLCSLHLWHCDGPTVSEKHPLTKLREAAIGHLLPEHIKYFLHWTALLRIEEKGQTVESPLHALWTESVEKRTKRGGCAPNLHLKSVVDCGDRFLHKFERDPETKTDSADTSSKGPQEGDFSIVSLEQRPWIACGVVTVSNDKEIHIILERDLSRRMNASTMFHIDTYESYATTVHNLTNLGVLMEDSDRALRLRNLIIDKQEPCFVNKLPREVGRLGAKLMRSLNIQQQRAVLRALAAEDYALLQGLPGTGKTQTISVLIQMFVGMKQRVLVTAHTHSAVDTVLTRLPSNMRIMRLGAQTRVSKEVMQYSETVLTTRCRTTQELEQVYDSMEVVGVTCLGASHAMLSRTIFDVCIVDEATQVLQCTVLRPLFAAKRFVLVGDPEQLPPVVRSRAARRLGMEESLFHRLMSDESTSTLQLQYRMNQPLVDVANKVAYSSRLKCADDNVANAKLDIDLQKMSNHCTSANWLSKACSPEPEFAAIFCDITVPIIENDSRSCTNTTEACVVLAIVEALKVGGVQSSDIGVIAPYRDQVSLLRRSLSRYSVDVSTVDQFQGRDKSVIIYSCTRSDVREEDAKVKEGEVLNDRRRLAVSVTRAKHKLVVVGCSRALRRYSSIQRLIEACKIEPLENNAVDYVVERYRKLII